MRVGDMLFISRDYTLADFIEAQENGFVSINGRLVDLIDIFENRLMTFYIDPAKLMDDNRYAFAEGIMCVSAIDLLVRMQSGHTELTNSGIHFMKWMENYMPEFKDNAVYVSVYDRRNRNTINIPKSIYDFYKDFRCGLVHEGRIKNGNQFIYVNESILVRKNGDIAEVNPKILLDRIIEISKKYIALLRISKSENSIEYANFKDTFYEILKHDCHKYKRPIVFVNTTQL